MYKNVRSELFKMQAVKNNAMSNETNSSGLFYMGLLLKQETLGLVHQKILNITHTYVYQLNPTLSRCTQVIEWNVIRVKSTVMILDIKACCAFELWSKDVINIRQVDILRSLVIAH